MTGPTETDLYTNRRNRVAVQVCSKWAGTDDWTEEQMQSVIAAADMTFTAKINDMDWLDATLNFLKQGDGDRAAVD